MQNQNPQANQFDPQVANLAKAIFTRESKGDFNAVGDAGTSHGAGQWQPDTWKEHAKMVLGDENAQMTPDNQKAVIYGVIKTDKANGLNPAQIAAKWNSGQPEGWENKIGKTQINGQTISYNVPQYVKDVTDIYQGYQQQGLQTANPTQPAQQDGAWFKSNPDDNLVTSALKTAGNIIPSTYNTGKNIVDAVVHPVDTVTNLGQTLFGAGEELAKYGIAGATYATQKGNQSFDDILKKMESTLPDDESMKKAQGVAEYFKNKYGSLDAFKKSIVEDPTGTLLDATVFIDGLGAVGKVADIKALTKPADILNTAYKYAGGAVADATKGVAKSAYNIATDVAGVPLGVSGADIQNAISASMKGGTQYSKFVEGLQGAKSEGSLVDNAKSALDEIENSRSTQYQDMLKTLKQDTATYDTAQIVSKMEKKLQDFGVAVNDGALSFKNSRFALDETAQKDIAKLYNYVKEYGADVNNRTAIGMDNLKKIVGSYYSPSSDYRAIVADTRSSIRGALESAPGYSKAMKNFQEVSDQIKDIRQGLSLGDRASVETSFKKLSNAYRQNNEVRQALIKELEGTVAGKGLSSQIAGYQMSSYLPKGMIRHFESVGGGLAVASGVGIAPLLTMALFTSPRLVANFIRGLGLPVRTANQILQQFGKLIDSKAIAGILSKAQTAENKGFLTPEMEKEIMAIREIKNLPKLSDAEILKIAKNYKLSHAVDLEYLQQANERMGGLAGVSIAQMPKSEINKFGNVEFQFKPEILKSNKLFLGEKDLGTDSLHNFAQRFAENNSKRLDTDFLKTLTPVEKESFVKSGLMGSGVDDYYMSKANNLPKTLNDKIQNYFGVDKGESFKNALVEQLNSDRAIPIKENIMKVKPNDYQDGLYAEHKFYDKVPTNLLESAKIRYTKNSPEYNQAAELIKKMYPNLKII